MSETGDKVVSDEERVRAALPTAYCKEQDVPHSSPGMNFCIRYNDWMGLSSWKPTESEAWAEAAKHPSVVAFEAQHRPASQPQNAELPPDRCGGDGTYPPILERDLDAFEMWWASYSLRPDAHVDSQRDSRAAWEAARVASIKPEAQEGAKVKQLTFADFQSMNIERCRKAFPMCDDWSLNDWAVALAGEVGELCNLLKKDRRKLASDERYILDGEYHELARANVLSELADVMTYADLMISHLKAITAEELLDKFNQVSRRMGYEVVAVREAGK